MSEEANGAAGLVAEIARLHTERARVRRWARAWKRAATARHRNVHEVRVQIDQKILVQGTVATIARTAFAAGLARGAEDAVWLLDLAHAENATLRDAHTAALAWLEARGALLPKAYRDELKEALHGH